MDTNHGVPVRLSYRKIRDVSTDAEVKNGAATYVAVLPAGEILKIGTEGNLRDYIPDHPGKKRSLVHKAIGKTIRDYPDRFSQLNSGFLIGGRKIAIDDQKKELSMWDASVNNGAQSQGEIKLYLEEYRDRGDEFKILTFEWKFLSSLIRRSAPRSRLHGTRPLAFRTSRKQGSEDTSTISQRHFRKSIQI